MRNLLPILLSALFPIGRIVGRDAPLNFRLRELSTHMVFNGGSGRGKSKIMAKIRRCAIDQGVGLTDIDPHGQGVEDDLAYIHSKPAHVRDAILDRTVLFEPGAGTSLNYPLFDYYPPPHVKRRFSGEEYRAWLATRVDDVSRIIIRRQGESSFEGMPRLERWLKNGLFAVGVALDGTGAHLGLTKLLPILDPNDPEHESLFQRVAPFLPPEILADFRKLRAERRPKDQEAWTESTVNRMRGFLLAPSVRALFCGTGPQLRPKEIIQKRMIFLVNLRRSDFLSVEHGQTIAGLFLQDLIRAAENIASYTPEEHRTPHLIHVDECERYLGDDVRMGYAELRKVGLWFGLGYQDQSCLRRGEEDFGARILSQGGIQLSFQQKNPEDFKLLAEFYAYANLDLTERMEIIQRHAGYRKIFTRSWQSGGTSQVTRSAGGSVNATEGAAVQRSRAKNRQRQKTKARGRTKGKTKARNWSDGGSATNSTTQTFTSGIALSAQESSSSGSTLTENKSRGLVKGGGSTRRGEEEAAESFSDNSQESQTSGTGLAQTSQRGASNGVSVTGSRADGASKAAGRSWSDGGSEGESDGVSLVVTDGGSEGDSTGVSRSRSRSRGRGFSWALARALGRSWGVSISESHQAIIEDVERPTGTLRIPIDTQVAWFAKMLRTMPKQHAMVGTNDGPSCVVRIADVPDPFAGLVPALRKVLLDMVKRTIYARHPFYYRPADAPALPAPAPIDVDDSVYGH